MSTKISDEARKARNAYLKAWRKKNPDKVKQYTINRWEKVARESKEGTAND